MSSPELLPSEGSAAAATTPGTGAAPALDYGSFTQALKQLQEGQSFQTELLHKLHKTVLTSLSVVNELVVSNNELKKEIHKIKGGGGGGPPPPPADPSLARDPSPRDPPPPPRKDERPQKKMRAAEGAFAARAELTVAGEDSL